MFHLIRFAVRLAIIMVILPFWLTIALVSAANHRRAPRFPRI